MGKQQVKCGRVVMYCTKAKDCGEEGKGMDRRGSGGLVYDGETRT